MPQVALTWVGRAVVVVSEIPRRHDPERPDDRQRARFGAAKGVLPLACVVDDLSVAPSREIDVLREHVARILIAGISTAVRRAFVVPVTCVDV